MPTLNDARIETTVAACTARLDAAATREALEEIRAEFLGRKGTIRQFFQQLATLAPEEKKRLGAALNAAATTLEERYQARLAVLESAQDATAPSLLERSLPGVTLPFGTRHPLRQVMDELLAVFHGLGFTVERGPEIEAEDYNFTMLNFPPNHPARDAQDTLYVDLPAGERGRMLLRTHTSPVQVRTMLSRRPPIKAVMPGRVFRRDAVDPSHQFNFHQLEGLVVDRGIRVSDLKGVLGLFARRMFGGSATVRFRPSFFPFTEPSLEMDVGCLICGGGGCPACKHAGYMEVLGCGMVHPKVFEHVGYGAETYTGFAFGMGVERVAMLRYRVDDMRLYYTNDLRFLRQF